MSEMVEKLGAIIDEIAYVESPTEEHLRRWLHTIDAARSEIRRLEIELNTQANPLRQLETILGNHNATLQIRFRDGQVFIRLGKRDKGLPSTFVGKDFADTLEQAYQSYLFGGEKNDE